MKNGTNKQTLNETIDRLKSLSGIVTETGSCQTDDDYRVAALEMEQNGGSFVHRIGGAYLVADSGNKEILKKAFHHIFDEYFRKFAKMGGVSY